MNDFITLLIQQLQTIPNEGIGVLLYIAALGAMMSLHRFFGKEGLCVFVALAVVFANIQSLKAIELYFFDSPIAMGSILFTLSLLATDILAEYYGKQSAIKAIWLGFSSMVIVSVIMILSISTQAIAAEPGSPLHIYVQAHQAMTLLFTPSPAIFLASLLAYLCSQYLDITLFLKMKHRMKGRFLALRTLSATTVAAFVDTCIFSILAWKVFYPLPISGSSFFWTYIVGGFGLRALLSLANIPMIYMIRKQKVDHVPYPA